jgi:hypothetical protein
MYIAIEQKPRVGITRVFANELAIVDEDGTVDHAVDHRLTIAGAQDTPIDNFYRTTVIDNGDTRVAQVFGFTNGAIDGPFAAFSHFNQESLFGKKFGV